MTAPTIPFRPVTGQLVTVTVPGYPGVYRVERVKQVKAVVRRVGASPDERGLDARFNQLAPHTGNVDDVVGQLGGTPYAPPPVLPKGTLGRIQRDYAEWKTTDLMVVINSTPGRVSITRLGGKDGDRYMRTGVAGFTVVDPADLGL